MNKTYRSYCDYHRPKPHYSKTFKTGAVPKLRR